MERDDPGAERIGLFGGTFDPPHLGHVAAVTEAMRSLGLAAVVVTVANDPQGKDAPPVADASTRLQMARAAFEGLPGVTVDDVEVRRGGPTYTIDTVEAMLDRTPSLRVVLILGADAAAGLAGWHRAAALAPLVTVAVVPRDGTAPAEFPADAGFVRADVAMEPVDLSSTTVREALGAGADPRGLVPPGVVRLLAAHPLYAP